MELMDIRRRLMIGMARSKNLMIEEGTYTPTEDVIASTVHIPHTLGTVPDFVVVLADKFVALSEYSKYYISNAFCSKTNLTYANGNVAAGYGARLSNRLNVSSSQPFNFVAQYTNYLYEDYFIIPYYQQNDDYLKAGITYHYFVGKFQE